MSDKWESKPSWRAQRLLFLLIVVVSALNVLVIVGPRQFLPPEQPAPVAVGPTFVRVTPAATEDSSPVVTPTLSPSAPPTARESPTTAPAGVLLRDTFDNAVMGRLAARDWTASPHADLLAVAAFPTSVDRSARLTAPSDSQPAVACRDLPDLPERYTLQADIRLSGDPAPGMLISVAASDAHAQLDRTRASVVFLDGGGSVSSDGLIEVDAWYQLTIRVDVVSASYAVRIDNLSNPGGAVLEEGLTLGSSGPEAGHLCFNVRTSSTAAMNIDNVVLATP